jgi:hypothetical protein
MRAIGDEFVETGFGFRHGVGPGDAGDIEAARLRLRDQRRFYFVGRS